MTARVACGLVRCAKVADFRLLYRRFNQPGAPVLVVNRCREHRHVIPRSAGKLLKVRVPYITEKAIR